MDWGELEEWGELITDWGELETWGELEGWEEVLP
jgi:hypothetical protein